jgi:hypothetical protein
MLLDIERAMPQGEAIPAMAALRFHRAKAFGHIGHAIAIAVLERDDQPAAGRGRRIAEIAPGPAVDIKRAIGRESHVARMAQIVGKDRGAKAGRQGEPAIVTGACRPGRLARRLGRATDKRGRAPGQQDGQQERDTGQAHRGILGLGVWRNLSRRPRPCNA